MKTYSIYIVLFAFMMLAHSCQVHEYDFEKASPECGIVNIVVNNQLAAPEIITPTFYEKDSLESKVKIGVNKLIDYNNITFAKFEVSNNATAYFNDEEINSDLLDQMSITAEYLFDDVDNSKVYGFNIKIVAENGEERQWHFYLKENPPIDLDFVNGIGTTYKFYNSAMTIGQILVAGRDNSGEGMWTFDYHDNLNRYMQLQKKNPNAIVLSSKGDNLAPDFNMRDDYLKFNANGTYQYSYGPDGLSMAQNETDSHAGYYIEEGLGEWSIEASDYKSDAYKIVLSNYNTGQSIALDKCFYASWETLQFKVLAGGVDKLQYDFMNWWK